jgi:predicted O-methyltransferase YrrM
MDYQGKVNGIDVMLDGNNEYLCFAFINHDATNYIQVTTRHPYLQSALELASSKDADVEITCTDTNEEHVLTRVRLLDR